MENFSRSPLQDGLQKLAHEPSPRHIRLAERSIELTTKPDSTRSLFPTAVGARGNAGTRGDLSRSTLTGGQLAIRSDPERIFVNMGVPTVCRVAKRVMRTKQLLTWADGIARCLLVLQNAFTMPPRNPPKSSPDPKDCESVAFSHLHDSRNRIDRP